MINANTSVESIVRANKALVGIQEYVFVSTVSI